MAELITLWSKKELKESEPYLMDKITAYRAGYLPKERREIENNLKNGILKGVTSTNALELGIDVGSLDCVVISGYPGTIISTWQQAGRAGRGVSGSLATLVAFQNPLDQYFMRHPKVFFDKSHEHAIIDLSNPWCPACIYSPKCGNENKPLDKKATILILKELLHKMEVKDE